MKSSVSAKLTPGQILKISVICARAVRMKKATNRLPYPKQTLYGSGAEVVSPVSVTNLLGSNSLGLGQVFCFVEQTLTNFVNFYKYQCSTWCIHCLFENLSSLTVLLDIRRSIFVIFPIYILIHKNIKIKFNNAQNFTTISLPFYLFESLS